jgi:hypothetical protein
MSERIYILNFFGSGNVQIRAKTEDHGFEPQQRLNVLCICIFMQYNAVVLERRREIKSLQTKCRLTN